MGVCMLFCSRIYQYVSIFSTEGLLKEDVLMVSFHPDLKEVAMAPGGEYIFVIDRSGKDTLSKMNLPSRKP